MVIKGKSVAGAKRLAIHLQRADTNERVELKELRGVAAEDLQEALREMEAVAAGGCPNCKKPFYHASINTRADERLTDQQRLHAIDRLEKELGLTDQARAVMVHEKEGREHCHVVWSRIDLESMRVISDSHNYRKHERVARDLEREFGHERVQGAHVERDGKPRPDRTPSHDEHQQASRTGVSPKAAKALMTEIWRTTRNGQEFQAALEAQEWLLARGDRRDFVGIDPKGGAHSIARRIEGVKAKDVRERFADLDPQKLMSVAEARAAQQERQPAQERQRAAESPKRTHEAPEAAKGRPDKREGVDAARAAEGVARGVGKAMEGIASAFESLFGGGGSSPERDNQPPDAGAPRPVAEQDEALKREQDELTRRRQKLLREFERDVPLGTERDAEIDRDRKSRDQGRERTRGE